MVIFMWAQSKNFVIGKNNKLPWSISEEMKFFVKKTLNKNIVMGRKTYDSIPNKPLKNKKSISVITKQKLTQKYNEHYFNSIEDALKKIDGDVIIIGGLQIFELAKHYVNELYISQINDNYEGDLKMHQFNIGNKNINLFEKNFTLKNKQEYNEFVFYQYSEYKI